MKNIMKTIQKISITVAFALLFVVFPGYVHSANAAFNNAANDCPTVSVANATTQQNASLTCWGPSVSANPGDHVNVRIYYHNTDTSPATAIVHLNSPAGATLSTFNFTGFVNSGAVGSGSVNISSPQTLTFNTVYWYPDQSIVSSALPGGQSNSSLFTSGINLGSIPGSNTCPASNGYCHSGSVVASFIVSTPVAASCTVNSFTINGSQSSASIAYGASATLAWNTANCTSVTVNGVTYTGAQANSDSVQTAALTATQNFSLTAPGASTHTVTANVGTVVVTSSCAINSFTINGSQSYATVTSGTAANLAWTTTGCSRVDVLSTEYTGANASIFHILTAPLTTTQNFTLTAYNTNGTSVTHTVTANVGNVVVNSTCSFNSFTINGSQSYATVTSGTAAQLAWSTSNCATITVNGVAYTGSQATSGSASTGILTQTQNFNMTAAGVATRTVTANVTQVAAACSITSFTADGSILTTVAYGATSQLAWTTSNCTNVTVNGVTYTGGQAVSFSVATPALTLPTNTFTLVAGDSAGNTDNRTVTINVSAQANACAVTSFTANGVTGSVQIPDNTFVTLAWTTNNCTRVTVNGTTYQGTQAASDSISVGPLNGTYNYLLSANDAAGNYSSRTITVTTTGTSTNSCVINSFTPTQSSVVSGNSTNLSWTTSNCQDYVTVSGTNLTSTQVYNSYISTGAIYGYSTYTLTAYNLNGAPVTSTTYVNVTNNNGGGLGQNCSINYFTANGGTSVQVDQGAPATIAWNTTGCSSVTVSGPGIYSQSQFGSMPSLGVNGSAIYTLTAYDVTFNNPQTQTVYVSSTQQNYYPPYPLPSPAPTPVPYQYPYPVVNPAPLTPASVTPITTIATNVSTTSARLNGLIPAVPSIGSVNAYFEYGTSQALGSQTNSQVVSIYTLQNYFNTISTVPGTTYYYRADVSNAGVITTGDIVSFTTPVVQTAPVYIDHVHNVTYGTGTGSALASLSITDQYQTIAPGDTILYTVNYKNVSNETLSNVVLSVILPSGVTYRYSTQGIPTTDNTVVATLGSLTKDEQGSISIEAVANMDILSGSNLVSTATLSFAVPSGAQDSAVAYYMNTVNSGTTNNTGAIYFGSGFFPTTFLGWVILIGLIIIIILLIRHYMLVNKTSKNHNQSHNGHNQNQNYGYNQNPNQNNNFNQNHGQNYNQPQNQNYNQNNQGSHGDMQNGHTHEVHH